MSSSYFHMANIAIISGALAAQRLTKWSPILIRKEKETYELIFSFTAIMASSIDHECVRTPTTTVE